MEINTLKRRKLDPFYLIIYQVKTKIELEYNGVLCQKDAFALFGVNLKGKRILLHYGINYQENSEFWLEAFRSIKTRGIEKIKYIVMVDEKNSKRALQINFPGVKVVTSPYVLIDRTLPYYPDSYKNKMPIHLRDLHLCSTVAEYRTELEMFKEMYEDNKIILLLLENDLENIEKYYEMEYNIRQMLFTTHFAREYKKKFRTEIIKGETKMDNIISSIYNPETQERSMLFNRVEFMKVLETYYDEIKEYL